MFYLLKSEFPLVNRFHFSMIPEKFQNPYIDKFQLFFLVLIFIWKKILPDFLFYFHSPLFRDFLALKYLP